MEHQPKYGGVAGYGTGHKGYDYGPGYVAPVQAYPCHPKSAGYGTGLCGYHPFGSLTFVLVLFILLVIILRAWW